MPPNQTINVITTQECDDCTAQNEGIQKVDKGTESGQEIIWINAITIILFHIVALIALLYTSFKMKLLTALWMFAYGMFAGFGVTGGAHRLWSHRAYKAKLPLQVLLLTAFAAAGMNSLYDWVRDHRVHHKFTETDADPHNSNRGFFFAHVGWLMLKKHPEVIRRGRALDMTDITEDPLLKFYNKYFLVFKILLCFVIPTVIPVYFWNETWLCAFCTQSLARYMGVLNATWSVNSFAHIWGTRPYDKRIGPVENIGVAFAALGEGWHNYHHVFPWDYKAAELGDYQLNITTMLLDFFAKIGWAYDLKSPSPTLIKTVIKKYGDGNHVPEVPQETDEKSE